MRKIILIGDGAGVSQAGPGEAPDNGNPAKAICAVAESKPPKFPVLLRRFKDFK